jgi:hypothetical protein
MFTVPGILAVPLGIGSELDSPAGPLSIVITVEVFTGGCDQSRNNLLKKGGAVTPLGTGQSQNVARRYVHPNKPKPKQAIRDGPRHAAAPRMAVVRRITVRENTALAHMVEVVRRAVRPSAISSTAIMSPAIDNRIRTVILRSTFARRRALPPLISLV